jgi:hypothetical protein
MVIHHRKFGAQHPVLHEEGRVVIVTKKSLPRRTVLRGLGVVIGLPLLDAMVPALTATRLSAAKPVWRFGATYVPMGMSMSETPGAEWDYWTPPGEGVLELSPILAPIASLRDRALVASGLGSHVANIKDNGPHPRTQTAWLTGTRCKATEGADIQAGISLDQVIAGELGKETQLSSLQVAIENTEILGACASRYSCAYSNTISWRNATTPIPMENNPRSLFERMFGASDSTDAKARLAYLRRDRSLLDSVVDELSDFKGRVGVIDTQKIDQYLESVRDIERRIQKAEVQADQELPLVEQPVGIPVRYEDHVKLMLDLLTIAYQSDLTRVFTFLMAREASNKAYPEIGVADAHHPLSHHANNAEKGARLAKINTFHVGLFSHFVERLKAIPEGDGTLLDHTVLLYGSGMSDPNLHFPLHLPTLVFAGSGIDITMGRHIKYPDSSKLSDFQLTLMEKIGLPEERFGDSGGRLPV